MIASWVNTMALVTGMILLSVAFDWKIGVAVGCLVYFHKDQERPRR